MTYLVLIGYGHSSDLGRLLLNTYIAPPTHLCDQRRFNDVSLTYLLTYGTVHTVVREQFRSCAVNEAYVLRIVGGRSHLICR